MIYIRLLVNIVLWVSHRTCYRSLLDSPRKSTPMKPDIQPIKKRISFRLLRMFYRVYGLSRAVRARVRGRVFSCTELANCRHLQNLVINSDGTVTCDCGDVTGEGQLGNLLNEP